MLSLRELRQMNTRRTGRVSLRLTTCYMSEIIKCFHTLRLILHTFNRISFRPSRFNSFI